MDCDGILKAWTIKVVPKRARRTVTSSDSAYSIAEVREDPRRRASGAGGCAASGVDVSVDVSMDIFSFS
jgi:hypothetical protein